MPIRYPECGRFAGNRVSEGSSSTPRGLTWAPTAPSPPSSHAPGSADRSARGSARCDFRLGLAVVGRVLRACRGPAGGRGRAHVSESADDGPAVLFSSHRVGVVVALPEHLHSRALHGGLVSVRVPGPRFRGEAPVEPWFRCEACGVPTARRIGRRVPLGVFGRRLLPMRSHQSRRLS